MTLEQFATLMSSTQSLLTSIALLVAAGWAIFRFKALDELALSRRQLQNLELDLRRGETELQNLEVDRQMAEEEVRRLVVEISIKPSQQSLPNDPHRYVSAVVEIESKGSRSARLLYGKDRTPLLVFRVTFNENGSLQYEDRAAYPVPVSHTPEARSPSETVRPGGREKIPFFFRVNRPGLHLLVFTARPSSEEKSVAKDLGAIYPTNWVAKEYFVVE
jgi:hypothetical protein